MDRKLDGNGQNQIVFRSLVGPRSELTKKVGYPAGFVINKNDQLMVFVQVLYIYSLV